MLTYNIKGKNITAKGSTELKVDKIKTTATASTSTESEDEEPTTEDTTTTEEQTTADTITTNSMPTERPMLELKTATEQWANSDGDYLYKFKSSDGSCTTNILDNPGDDLALGAIDRYTGDMLGSCSNFDPNDITSVVILHQRGDGWMGEYLKLYLDDRIFKCPLGKWTEKDSPEVEFPCHQESGPTEQTTKKPPSTANMPSEDNLLATLPTWGPHFEVSFDVRIESYDVDIHGTDNYTELIRFTSTDTDCCSAGDRIPGIFARNGIIFVFSQLGTEGNHRKYFSIRDQTWVKVVIKQYMEDGNGKVFIESVDNNSTFSQFSSGSMKLVWIQCPVERRVC